LLLYEKSNCEILSDRMAHAKATLPPGHAGGVHAARAPEEGTGDLELMTAGFADELARYAARRVALDYARRLVVADEDSKESLLTRIEADGIRGAVILEAPARTLRPWSALADIRWQYDSFDFVGVGGRTIRRPLVPVSIGRVGCEQRTQVTFGPIDSGADFALADWGLADELELEPTTSEEEIVTDELVGAGAPDAQHPRRLLDGQQVWRRCARHVLLLHHTHPDTCLPTDRFVTLHPQRPPNRPTTENVRSAGGPIDRHLMRTGDPPNPGPFQEAPR
jgi:hypothetical protein